MTKKIEKKIIISPGTMKIEKRTIGPVEAKKLLEKNNINRPLSDRYVSFYHQQMAAGEWLETGDTIKIASDGTLLDGQHRLNAVIKYNKPMVFQVATGVDPNSFLVLDTGKSRSAADVAAIQGYSYATTQTAAAKAILLFKSGYYTQDHANRKSQASNTKVMEFLATTPELLEICSYVTSIYNRFRVISKTSMVMLYYLFSERHQEMCDEFFEKYSSGADLGDTSPIRILRERLMRDYQNKTKMSGRDKIAITIMAWNAFREKKRIQVLTLQKNYKFPKPI